MSRRSGGTIRRRIVRTLALPVVVGIVLLGVIAVDQVDNYRSAAATSRAVTLDLAVQDLVQELQTERGVTAGLLGGNAGFKDELTTARQRVDTERQEVVALAEDNDSVKSALAKLDGLAAIRAGADAGSKQRTATFAFYTTSIAELTNVDFGLDSSGDTELRRGVSTLEALSQIKEATAQERAFLNGVFSASGFRTGEYLQFVTMRSAKDAAQATFGRYATGSESGGMTYLLGTGAAQEASYFEQVALASADNKYLQVNPQSWWSAQTTVLDDMLTLEQHVGSVIKARADVLRNEATVRMAVLLGAVLICFAGSVYLATVASRSVARPLDSLAEEANRLASVQLPEAVRRATQGVEDAPPPPVQIKNNASDEVRLVADAFDRVQATAYALATEQAQLRRSSAESLANLGRRNQNLLRRQLGFITRLEREEASPTGLANLFELDHLATRMRRNAESLLVIVGAASPRQWSQPLPVSDVIRAAVSEVEEYRRVTLRRVDDAMVAGSAASGIAHMLAELIENGLAFSPPDVDVEIHGRMIANEYLIAVSDQGVGMNAAELEKANERLRGEGDFLTAPARFLGHYVVGRLAVEMGVTVQLTPSPVTGVTARITLPAELLASPAAVPAPATPSTPPEQIMAQGPASRGARLRALADYETRALPSEPATEITVDGRLRPTSVEYVVMPDNTAPVSPAPVQATASVQATARIPAQRSAPDDEGDPGRTANGLRRRTPRGKRAGGGGDKAQTAVLSAPEERSDTLTDSPDALRSRLTAFREGVRRGSNDRP